MGRRGGGEEGGREGGEERGRELKYLSIDCQQSHMIWQDTTLPKIQ